MENVNDEHDTKPFVTSQSETVVVEMVTGKDEIFYNMKHKNSGFAVIFNHENFDDETIPQRDGTDIDSSKLKGVLKDKFGFQVSIFKDLTKKEIMQKLQIVAEMDHNDSDCLIICVLSHGKESKIYAKDVFYDLSLLWQFFTADKCRSLAGKPKLFFIQACQGEKTDPGVLVKRTQSDGDSSYWLPAESDFLIGYSTVPGYLSWKNKNFGSYYIDALVNLLETEGTKTDLVSLLTSVNRKVATNFVSYVPGVPSINMKKQMPSFTSRLTRLLMFGEK